MVYVLNYLNQPLMPTKNYRKVRILLRQHKAKVVKRTPFTIKLLYRTKTYVQPIILGVDAGSKTVGLFASTDKQEIFSCEVKLRNDITNNLSIRKELRRNRRNKKRHRKHRYKNRIKTKKKGWLAPSVLVKIQEHITIIKRISNLLPLSKIVIETAEFDIQKLKEKEDNSVYGNREGLNFYNKRQYVLWRDNYTCQNCGASGNNTKFHVHHLQSRKNNGNAYDNLITLCEQCHTNYHKGLIQNENLGKRKGISFKHASFMGIMRKSLLKQLKEYFSIPVIETKGYITKFVRENILKIEKTHINDALAIAQGPCGFNKKILSPIKRNNIYYLIKPVRHHNRKIHKATFIKGGKRKNNQAPKYVKNFRLFDKVLYEGKECFIWGRKTTGVCLLKTLQGEKIKDSAGCGKMQLLERSSNYLIQKIIFSEL